MYNEECKPEMALGSVMNESQTKRLDRRINEASEQLSKMKELKQKLEKNPEILDILDLMRSLGI